MGGLLRKPLTLKGKRRETIAKPTLGPASGKRVRRPLGRPLAPAGLRRGNIHHEKEVKLSGWPGRPEAVQCL